MTTPSSYVPPRFQWLLAGLVAISFLVVSTPMAILWLSSMGTNQSSLVMSIGYWAMQLGPAIIAIVAALVARRRPLAARVLWGVLLGIGLTLLRQVITVLFGMIPALDFLPSLVSMLLAPGVAVLMIVAIILYDRFGQPTNRFARWRIWSAAGAGLLTLIMLFLGTVLSDPHALPMALSAPLGVLIVVAVTYWLFRRLPPIERLKRLLLLFILFVAAGSVTIAVLAIVWPELSGLGGLVPLIMALIAYAFGARSLLRAVPVTAPQLERRSV